MTALRKVCYAEIVNSLWMACVGGQYLKTFCWVGVGWDGVFNSEDLKIQHMHF
jgi:hypothetical protein